MKLSLFDFQEDAVEKVVVLLKSVRGVHRMTGLPQAVVLSAPTGAGKTVIATAVIEALLVGNDELPKDAAATFLWVTDQPELNRQTAHKMLEASSSLVEGDIIDIENDFAQERLAPGRIYFINTQKLRSGANLVKRDDDHPFTFWDSLRNTIEDGDTNLFVVIDEAHRGTTQTEEEDVVPIMQRFLFGTETDDGAVPPAPVVLGISATPERFDALLEGSTHGKQPVIVDPARVIASGLIKDTIHIVIPPDVTRTDELSLLRTATEEWVESSKAWAAYNAEYGGQLVVPILMVQVADSDNPNQLSTTDIASAVKVIRDAAGDLAATDDALAHAFGTKQDEAVDGISLRYLAPSDIEHDEDVRVVFFKTSLNQGWDCPRAEVMMSFRRHQDATLIAQLVGRMVRTPLARRITERDELNSVELFLPHFDETTVNKVRDNLKGVVPSETDTGTEPPITLERAPDTDDVFALLETIPTYTVPRIRKTKQTRRAIALAGLLDQHGLTEDSLDTIESELVKALLDAYATQKDEEAFKNAVAEGGVISVLVKAYDAYGADIGAEDERREVEASASRADDLFRYAGRVFGASLHKPYWRARYEADGKDVLTKAKLEAAVLASDAALMIELEKTARSLVDGLFNTHGSAIDALDAGAAADFERIRGQADEPVKRVLKLPESIRVRRSTKLAPPKHVYVEPGTEDAPLSLGTWERQAVEEEAADEGFIAWLRNFDRREYSLAIPYTMAGEKRPVYPDLLSVHGEGEELRIDLLDPHNPDLEDAVAKAQGLAEYAKLHGHLFGRIDLIIKVDKVLKRIDLKDSAKRQKIFDARGSDALKNLYV
jgi:type III restriction enzyme